MRPFKAFTYGDTTLYAADMKIVEENGWLNDNLIQFAWDHMKCTILKDKAKEVLLLGPSVVFFLSFTEDADDSRAQLASLDIDQKYVIMAPINDNENTLRCGGTHWSLLLGHRHSDGTVSYYHYDSVANSSNASCAQRLLPKITYAWTGADTAAFSFVEAAAPQQANGFDCGVHLIANARYIAESIKESGDVYTRPEGSCLPSAKEVRVTRLELADTLHELSCHN